MAATSPRRCGELSDGFNDGPARTAPRRRNRAPRHSRRPGFAGDRHPLAITFGMFAFGALGDEYFAHGAMAELVSAVIAGLVCVLLGERSTRVHAPCITKTFFLGLLLYSLLHRASTVDAEPDGAATLLLVFFAIVLLGGLLQALFGLLRLGSLIAVDAPSATIAATARSPLRARRWLAVH